MVDEEREEEEGLRYRGGRNINSITKIEQREVTIDSAFRWVQ